eukprot:NODE_399_length_1408_cov_353.530537_g295_i0.p1 GENE.NODE_399_length_1408_cov_353.530537_g295_i0~~NODE_399_length_1408_cov_353.530537_g295_i0.p1  ORF type:complete len:234 (+),score=60.80 NODE_399_length_1408_cov_353.530537_g295_i0:171-872(+)
MAIEPKDGGLEVIFRVAEADNVAALSGLNLLSQLCQEEGMDITPMACSAGANGRLDAKRVGLRPPTNEYRDEINLLDAEASTRLSLREIYQYYCTAYKCKPNSKLLSQLPTAVGPLSMRELTLSENLVGDRGILPVLELVRLNPQLHTLWLPDNGLRNTAVECLVHMALEHPSLTDIDLSNNRITLGAGKVLQELARKNNRLVRINLSGTRIDEQLQARIQQRLDQNQAQNRA